MPNIEDAAGAEQSFDVVIVGFAPRDEPPELGLKRVFGIDDAAAAKVVREAPVTVQRAVNRVRAEYFRKALELIGAHVEVRTPAGLVVHAPGLAEAVTARPPALRKDAPWGGPVIFEGSPSGATSSTERPLPPTAAAAWHPATAPATPIAGSANATAFAASPAAPALALAFAAPATAPAFAAPPAAAPAFASPAQAPAFSAPYAFDAPAQAPAFSAPQAAGAPAPTAVGTPSAFKPPQAAPAAGSALAQPSAAGSALGAPAPTAFGVPAFVAGAVPVQAATAPAPAALPDTAFALRAPAHRTLTDGSQSAVAGQAPPATAPDNMATAQTQNAPASAFRFDPTHPPFMDKRPAQPAFAAGAVAVASPQNPQPSAAEAAPAAGVPISEADTESRGVYGGLSWGEINRGRHISGQNLFPDFVAAAAAAAPQPPMAALALASLPGLVPAAPQAAAVVPAPAAAHESSGDAGNTPRSDISASIKPGAAMPAPSTDKLLAAVRKQAILAGDSNLSVPRDGGPNLAMLKRWEQPNPDSMAEPEFVRPTPARAADAALADATNSAAAAPAPGARAKPRTGRAAARPEAKRAGAAAARPAPKPRSTDTRSFWQTIGDGIKFPFLGSGVSWIVSITVWGALVAGLSAIANLVPLIGPIISFALNTSLLALCAEYHQRCMWAVASGESALDEGPDFDPGRIVPIYLRSGANLTFFLIVSQLPLVFWLIQQILGASGAGLLEIASSPITWLLAVGPGFYWPMAMITASLNKDFVGVWYLQVGVRGLLRAPLAYIAISISGLTMFVVGWSAFLLAGVALGLPGVFFAATIGLPLALGHGVMGALAGHLLRAQPKVFA